MSSDLFKNKHNNKSMDYNAVMSKLFVPIDDDTHLKVMQYVTMQLFGSDAKRATDDHGTDDDGDDSDDSGGDGQQLCCKCRKREIRKNKHENAIHTQNGDANLKQKRDSSVCKDGDCHISNVIDDDATQIVDDDERKKRRNKKKKEQKKKQKERKRNEKATDVKRIDADAGDEKCTKILKNANKNEKKNDKINDANDTMKNINKKMDLLNVNGDKPTNVKITSQLENNNLDHNALVKSKLSPKSDHSLSNRSDRENGSDAEEEALMFNSAYVTQIAQRKSKPTKPVPSLDKIQYQFNSKVQNNLDSRDNSHCDKLRGNSMMCKPKNVLVKDEANVNNGNDVPLKVNGGTSMPKPNNSNNNSNSNSNSINSNIMKVTNIEKSHQLGAMANQKAFDQNFSEAIQLLTEAIALNPSDYRFYVNRSYCFDSFKNYRSALRDAETAIRLRPDWPKGYYRKGRALAGLKNYHEAEIALNKVITFEKDCEEAKSELYFVRYGALVNMGYDEDTAKLFATHYNSTQEAIDALTERDSILKNTVSNRFIGNNIGIKSINTKRSPKEGIKKTPKSVNEFIVDDDDIYISDDDSDDKLSLEFESAPRSAKSYNSDLSDDNTGLTNQMGWNALWIGNLALNAKCESLIAMFKKFGELKFFNISRATPKGTFALVHYDNPESPRLAMSEYQGKIINNVSCKGLPLKIRFRPNKDQIKPNYTEKMESDECYYWRTTGCSFGDNCRKKHIPANAGVDYQVWMNTAKGSDKKSL